MGSCIIFCAGAFRQLVQEIEADDLVIAADGGFLHTQQLGLTPQIILGDFDSLGFVPDGAVRFPVEKADTDAVLAVRQGLQRGFDRFVLYGTLEGPRLDHTVSNFQTLLYLASQGAKGYLVGNNQIATLVKNGTLTFPAGCQGTVSVFAVGGQARGVTLEGLYYGLTDGTLTPDFPLGVSNHFTGGAATIGVKEGALLVIYDRNNALPGGHQNG